MTEQQTLMAEIKDRLDSTTALCEDMACLAADEHDAALMEAIPGDLAWLVGEVERVEATRDAALQRAEQAEAALAQAQAKRDSLIKRLDFWIECNNGERANGRMPTFLNPYTILLWIGDKRVAAEADVAQPPALPPLPEGWVREGVRDIILYRSHDRYTGVDGHVPPGGQVSVHAEGLRVSTTHVPVADLLIVLRHAEAAHQQLKEGK